MSSQSLIKVTTAAALFAYDERKIGPGEQDPIAQAISAIREQVEPLVFDMDTKAGRVACASAAARVASTKVFLDGLGKEFVAEQKAAIRTVDQRRKQLRDALDALKEKVRRPLTAIEEEAKKEKAQRLENIRRIKDVIGNPICPHTGAPLPVGQLREKLALLQEMGKPDQWYGEVLGQAVEAYEYALRNLEAAVIVGENRERKEAEEQARQAEERAAAGKPAGEVNPNDANGFPDYVKHSGPTERAQGVAAEHDASGFVRIPDHVKHAVVAKLMWAGLNNWSAVTAFEAIAAGRVPHCQIVLASEDQ